MGRTDGSERGRGGGLWVLRGWEGGASSLPTALQGEVQQGREGRQTALGCARTGVPSWLRLFHPMSLFCSHLWLPSHSLTADLGVKWGWGGHLRWDKLLAGIAGSIAAGGLRVLICKTETHCGVT